MKLIPLSQGQFAKVDDADFEELSKYNWFADWSKDIRRFYAVRNLTTASGKRTTIRMHRHILGLTDGKIKGDHKNYDGLDNQRANLRPATNAQNMMNSQGARRGSRTGARGVTPHGPSYSARITVNRKMIYLGTFATIAEASAAYAIANRLHFGEFGGGL